MEEEREEGKGEWVWAVNSAFREGCPRHWLLQELPWPKASEHQENTERTPPLLIKGGASAAPTSVVSAIGSCTKGIPLQKLNCLFWGGNTRRGCLSAWTVTTFEGSCRHSCSRVPHPQLDNNSSPQSTSPLASRGKSMTGFIFLMLACFSALLALIWCLILPWGVGWSRCNLLDKYLIRMLLNRVLFTWENVSWISVQLRRLLFSQERGGSDRFCT